MALEINCSCKQTFAVRKDHKMMGYKCENCGKVEPFKETKKKEAKPKQYKKEFPSENLENEEV